jgi:sugar lactone lactonase YvrE
MYAKFLCRFNTEIVINADATGRLLKYDAQMKRVAVLKEGLLYPNGVAISYDMSYVLVAHTTPCQVFRYYLKGPKAGHYELFADLPDNVRRDGQNGYWVERRRAQMRRLRSSTWLGCGSTAMGWRSRNLRRPKVSP